MTPSLHAKLIDLLGSSHVMDSAEDRTFYSMDIYGRGAEPDLAICPTSTDQLAEAVGVITDAGHAVVPRGGGVSYTGGIVPDRTQSVVVDTSCMAKVLAIDPESMYVTVEAGCTWELLRIALRSHGLRTPFWGPLSGSRATIGGSLAQQAVMWGSSAHGPSSDSVLGLEVVMADGSIMRTGMGAMSGAEPFWRHYGPDLTGLFLADAGALGVKAQATLRLIRKPEHADFASFSFSTRSALTAAMTEIARSGLANSGFSLDPIMQDHRIRRAGLRQGAEAVREMIGSADNKLTAIRDVVRMTAKGRGFLDPEGYSLHLVVDGPSRAAVDASLRAINAICAEGRKVEATVPRLLHAKPYASLTSALGPEGQRWAPLNCILPLARANTGWERLERFFAERAALMEGASVEVGFMVSTISTTAILIEMVMTWPGPLTLYYNRVLEPSVLKRFPLYDPQPESEELVARIRDDLMDLFVELGAAHLQIGRRYPYRRAMDQGTWELLSSLKNAVDPRGLMNPGALGLT